MSHHTVAQAKVNLVLSVSTQQQDPSSLLVNVLELLRRHSKRGQTCFLQFLLSNQCASKKLPCEHPNMCNWCDLLTPHLRSSPDDLRHCQIQVEWASIAGPKTNYRKLCAKNWALVALRWEFKKANLSRSLVISWYLLFMVTSCWCHERFQVEKENDAKYAKMQQTGNANTAKASSFATPMAFSCMCKPRMASKSSKNPLVQLYHLQQIMHIAHRTDFDSNTISTLPPVHVYEKGKHLRVFTSWRVSDCEGKMLGKPGNFLVPVSIIGWNKPEAVLSFKWIKIELPNHRKLMQITEPCANTP